MKQNSWSNRPIPSTEGIKYIGSKLKLLRPILALIGQVKPRTVLDGFSGSTRVSQALAQEGYRVLANDVSIWSEIFGRCYLCQQGGTEAYQGLIDHLNAVPPQDGWFTEHYGGHPNQGSSVQTDGLKKPWQIHNTQKLDGIRQEIDRLNLSPVERAVSLTSLMLALDDVDNTLGHFSSYLNRWSARSYQPLRLRVPHLFCSAHQNEVFRADIFETLKHVSADLAYFDPPYGSNNEKMPPSRVRYAAYYHLWTTICLNDKPTLFGKACRRTDSSDFVAASPFEDFRRNEAGHFVAVDAIDRLIKQTRARWILLSYSSGGRATANELERVLEKNGTILQTLKIDYQKNVMADMSWSNQWIQPSASSHQEYLFLLQKFDAAGHNEE